jgi:hypothetical protein
VGADTNIAVTDFSGTGCLSPSEDMMAMRAGLQTSPGYRWIGSRSEPMCRKASAALTLARATRWRTASAPRSATTGSPGSAHGPSKSRLNFLDLLRAGHTDFVLNSAAFDHMRDRALSAALIAAWPNNRRRRLPIRPPGRRIFTGLALPN